MKRKIFGVAVTAIVLLAVSMPALAHHSFTAAFDPEKPITVKGVITKVRLENPHSWFFLEVKDANGKVETWAFEAGTPSGMIRNGYKPDLIKAGTEVTIKGLRARDASQTMGMLQQLVTADGKVYGLFGPQEAR